jgi:integrase
MTRKRSIKGNRGLPKRWSKKHGAYYYQPADAEAHRWDNKKWFRLGATLADAHREFAKRADLDGNVSTMRELADRYELEVVGLNAPATQKLKRYSLDRIRDAFDDNPVDALDPQHIYKYRDWCARNWTKKTANLDLEVLSHMFSKSVEWGARVDNPMTNRKVSKFSLASRDRYVTDEELARFRTDFAGDFLNAYLELKGLTGLRKGDLLAINHSDFQAGHMVVVPRKTKAKKTRPLRFKMTADMDAAVAAIKTLPRPIGSIWLFCTRKGQPYINTEDGTTSGFDSIWQRRMKKWVDAGNERFTEHDLRAKVASDMATDIEAQEQLDNSSAALNKKVYRRKGKVLQPAQGFPGKRGKEKGATQ